MDKKKHIQRESFLFDRVTIKEIQRAAKEGIYRIRGFGAKRKIPHFDDLVFLGASVSRYPLEGYRESCDTNVDLGTRFCDKPLSIDIVTDIKTGMKLLKENVLIQEKM